MANDENTNHGAAYAFDDEHAMKVLHEMVQRLRPGSVKSEWTMQDQFHLVMYEWRSQIQPASTEPLADLVKAVGMSKAKKAKAVEGPPENAQ